MRKYLLAGLLTLFLTALLAAPSQAADQKWFPASVGMPTFLTYNYYIDSYSGRLQNDNEDWEMYLDFPIVMDVIGSLPSSPLPRIHAMRVSTYENECLLYTVSDTNSSSYTSVTIADTPSYNSYQWASVPSYTTTDRRHIRCNVAKKTSGGVRSGISGFYIPETGSDTANDAKVFPGYMCRPQTPNDDYLIVNSLLNVSASSRVAICPIISDNTGDLTGTIYVTDQNSSGNFTCTLLDINPTSGAYYYNSQSSSGSSTSLQALNFGTITSHYTNGYRAIRCSIPGNTGGSTSTASNIAAYYIYEQS